MSAHHIAAAARAGGIHRLQVMAALALGLTLAYIAAQITQLARRPRRRSRRERQPN
jgi:hypothetical protein